VAYATLPEPADLLKRLHWLEKPGFPGCGMTSR
jgi:hypothetical protein